jgi:aryl-alcohol dehydrogenase-like predicted oxidoreductase
MAAWEFQTLQNIAEKHGWHKFVSMQNYYNLLYREEGKWKAFVLLALRFYYLNQS